MAAQLKIFHTIASRLNQLEIRNDQLVFVEDVKRVYLDMNGLRIEYDGTVIFDTEDERMECKNPQGEFYFVIDTNTMWLYDGEWICMNDKPEEVIYFDGTEGNGGCEESAVINREWEEIGAAVAADIIMKPNDVFASIDQQEQAISLVWQSIT